MKLTSIVLAVLVLTSVVFAGCTKSQNSGGLTIKDGVLTIGMEIGYPPMEYYADNGSLKGFDVDMGKAIAEKMGLKVEFVNTGWDGIFASVDTGKFDCIMSSVTITPARLDAHNFSKPYIATTLVMVLLKGSSISARSPRECTGLNVTYQDETTSDFYMQDLRTSGLNFNVFEYEKVMYCFDELRLGRVDVIITDLLVANEYISQANSPFEVVWESSEPEHFGICMKKGNDALTQAIDKALDELFADGTMLRISQSVFGMDMVTATRQKVETVQRMLSWIPALLSGARITITLTILAVSAGLILSLFLALGKMSKNIIINKFCCAYIFFFRGTPLLMQLYFIYYALPMMSEVFVIKTGTAEVDRFIYAFIAFSLNCGAYCAEIIRAAIQSIDKGQFEASRALGLSNAQTMRLVIIPQSIRRLIPPVGNEFIMMLKDASLVSMIALTDIIKVTRNIEGSTRSALVYVPAMVLYLVITAVFTFVFNKLEKKYSVYE